MLWFEVLARNVTEAGRDRVEGPRPEIRQLRDRGLVDPPVLVTVSPKHPLSSTACTSHRLRRDRSPAPLSWREVSSPRSAETRVSPISGTVPSSMVATSGGIRR